MQKNKIFCLAEHFGINYWILHQNEREQINSLNSKQKRAEWYKSSNPEEKENFRLAEQNGTKHWILLTKIRLYHKSKLIRKLIRNSVPHELDHKITAFQSKIREGSYYICSVCNNTIQKNCYPIKKTNLQHSAGTIY